jgi:hypothetical protein
MAEVQITSDTPTFYIEPEGGSQSALPDSSPVSSPPEPFNKLRTFFSQMREGEVSPLNILLTDSPGQDPTVIEDSGDGGTRIKQDHPNPFVGSNCLLLGGPLAQPDQDSFTHSHKFKLEGPAPVPGEFLNYRWGLQGNGAPQAVAITYDPANNFSVVVETPAGAFVFPNLAPYVQGDEHEWKVRCKPLSGSQLCLTITAIVNGVIVAFGSVAVPTTLVHRLSPIFTMQSNSGGGPVQFGIILRQYAINYRPLAVPEMTC